MNPPRSYNGGVLFIIRLLQFNQNFVSQRFTLTPKTTQSGKISNFTFCSMFSLFFILCYPFGGSPKYQSWIPEKSS